ncbi:MAG: hypothetical protein GF418_04270 [Chitinivibrionales bacterium]|nr:hypothetical protein [Chitinivibrionales bacterium]MBD3394823.1 hypothetical protein [Chitinivibrionales bacterium]
MMAAKKRKKYTRKPAGPRKPAPLPARYVLAGIAVVSLIVAFPLLTVWKQVYITNSSRMQDRLADSVAVLAQEASRLRLAAEKLAANERIERIARESLGLEYPASRQLVIVRPAAGPRASSLGGWRFLTVLRKSLNQEQG